MKRKEVMPARCAKWIGASLFGSVLMFSGLYSKSESSRAETDTGSPRQKTVRPLVMAHRGGAGLWPENTLLAFERARDLGVDVIETDVHSTSDGVLVIMHDSTVDRTTGGTGRLQDMTLAEVKRLDAGYRWSADMSKTFPWRGRGLLVPTLEEVFTRLPGMRFNIEPKQGSPSLIKPLCRIIQEKGMADKVMVGSFSQALLDEFRKECPEVATSAGPTEVGEFLRASRVKAAVEDKPKMRALQVPEYVGGIQVLTKDLVQAAHSRGLQVHAWTVNETEDMRRLLEAGVDGIVTDYPDRLINLLKKDNSTKR
jgi:glycerophosphoryl diester phosphodiesterase